MNATSLGSASGQAARFLAFQALPSEFRAQNAEHMNKPLGFFF